MKQIHYDITPDNKLILTEMYIAGNYVVPVGYVSDGLTIPWFFKPFVNKFNPKYIPCAFAHDYLTDNAYKEYKKCNRKIARALFKKADDLFRDMLREADGGKLEVSSWVMVKSVLLWHYVRYGII